MVKNVTIKNRGKGGNEISSNWTSHLYKTSFLSPYNMKIYIYFIIETRKISRRVEEGISVQNKYVESRGKLRIR
tara:strand:- start:459 stop:680 length:222 start_codon:yes stop_codon:yes gene_type:complete